MSKTAVKVPVGRVNIANGYCLVLESISSKRVVSYFRNNGVDEERVQSPLFRDNLGRAYFMRGTVCWYIDQFHQFG